ncbi:hypothetical protein GCM10007377_06300 [Galliscardovia ingluviei]|uniref:GntR C-terminal domain-containing protein n=1 Tax=Galliscardovia ingluviei TaxID=1769422 RepID=A0A8J3F1M4_9BIFI|nr:FCD domain-containing protein [Galliscardovia ingluviei]GGI13506.1 hypothetical protein GCM10007377_06300 [Galliscardovia ingluviei]
MNTTQPMQPTTLQYDACKTLALDILEGRWTPGNAITLDDIQTRFDTSRTVAREVAKNLESLKVVEIRKRVGLIAQVPSTWNALDSTVIHWKLQSSHRIEELMQLTQLRLAIEPEAAAATAQHASLELRTQFIAWAAQLRLYGLDNQLEQFHEIDQKFHSTILQASHNDLFATLSETIDIVLAGRVEIGLYPPQPKVSAIENHEAVANAIAEQNPEQARIAMRRIVDEVSETLYA